MNHDNILDDPAFPAMTLDILNNMLSRSENPGQLAKYLTEEIRELTGARCVLLVQCLGNDHKVIDINPARLRNWAESPEAQHLYEIIHDLRETQLWHLKEPSEISSLLQKNGFKLSITVPLRVGLTSVGAMLLLGLPDEQHIKTEIDLLTTLSKVLALVLRNSFLYENQEKAIAERTKELIKSEERFRAIFERSTIGKSLTLPDGKLLKVNQAFCDLLGYSPEEMHQLNFTDITHPDDIAKSRECVRSLLSNEQNSHRMEKRYIQKNGKTIWTDVSTTLLRDEVGTNLYFITSISDMTNRKNAEEELQESKTRFQKIFNSQLDAIFVLNADQPPATIECNLAAQEIFGYSINELIGNSVNKLHISESHLKQFQDIIYPDINNHGFIKDVHFSMKRKNGTIFPTEHVVLEIKNDKEERTGWISIVRDLTERKQLESRLQQAQKMESIGNLAGGIAHDFNNLLFPIIGMAEMLLEDLPSNSVEYENAQEIFNAGIRAGDLVKQILAFGRKSEHKMVPVRIQKILKEVLKLSRSTIPTDIEIHQDIQVDCGSIKADATQIHQIAMNLITNAYHAVEQKSGVISVQLKQITLDYGEITDSSLEQGQYIVLTISDTGAGIEPNILGKIFEPYFTTKKQGKGTGLGLAVVFGIVKEHQGDIKVYSEIGKGTTFNVYLPLMKKSTKTISANQIHKLETGTERILLVDDEISVAKLESQMLSRLGYRVNKQIKSLDALKIFKANPDNFDLVITDMTMPNMTGEQLTKELMSIRPDIPIIICTGFSERITKEQAEANKVKGFLMKPVMKSEMAKMVRKVLNEAKIS